MSIELLRVLVPGIVSVPPGAQWAAWIAAPIFNGLQRLQPDRWRAAAHAIWRALEDHGRRRASRHLLVLVQRYEVSDPEIARQIRDAARALDAPR